MEFLDSLITTLQDQNEALNGLYYLLIVVFGLIGAYLFQQRVDSSQDSSQGPSVGVASTETKKAAIAEASQLEGRFTKSVEQLNSKKLAERMDAIYELEKIAHSSDKFYPQAIETLTAHLREHAVDPNKANFKPYKDNQAILTVLGRANNNGRVAFDLSDTFLHQYKFVGDFSKAYFRGADFSSADCRDANFSNSNCSQTNFNEADLMRVNFRNSECRGTDFTGADCRGANFTDADCVEAVFTDTNCVGANFSNTDLQLAIATNADCAWATFIGANCNCTTFTYANCTEANFTNANGTEASFSKANCTGATFSGVNLTEATFSKANCTGANFNDANCTGTGFSGANCTGAIFANSNCFLNLFKHGSQPHNPMTMPIGS